jgi:hypothetical protein
MPDHEPTGGGHDPNGLRAKYTVTRTDGRDKPGQPHDGCFLFVLDATHDPAARKALLAYIDAVVDTRPALAHDLEVALIRLARARDNATEAGES